MALGIPGMKTESEWPLDNNTSRPFEITKFEVAGLFDSFDYELDFRVPDRNQLAILYGENGTGKTTILKLIFHLLSSAPNRGHRTALLGVPFRELALYLANGTTLRARRPQAHFAGRELRATELYLSIKSGPHAAEWNPAFSEQADLFSNKKPERRSLHDAVDSGEDAYLHLLASLSPDVMLLGDDRILVGDRVSSTAQQRRRLRPDDEMELGAPSLRNRVLESVIAHAIDVLRRRSILASGRATSDATMIYADLVGSLLGDRHPVNSPAPETERQQLLTELATLSRESLRLSHVGLSEPGPYDQMQKQIHAAPADRISAVASALRPFIQAENARHERARSFSGLVSDIVDTLNTYLKPKRLDLSLSTGVSIRAGNGRSLSPSDLSSGERQLLLLFFSMVLFGDRPTVLMVDEPEISLNVRWLRPLLGDLLRLAQRSRAQLLLASHSIELLTQHSDAVVELIR